MEILSIDSRWRAAAVLAWVLLGWGAVAEGQGPARSGEGVRRESVHSAFVLNLARFIRWPDTAFAAADAPLVIGTLARDPINEALDADVENEQIGTHPIQVIRLRSMNDVAGCHIVFLSAENARHTPALLAQVRGKPILAISDAEGFLELGGHVLLVPRGQRTGLRLHQPNLKSSGLTASSQLLRIAEVVNP